MQEVAVAVAVAAAAVGGGQVGSCSSGQGRRRWHFWTDHFPNAQELTGSGTGTGAGNRKLDWAGLDWTGQDRTSHSTRQV